MALLSKSLKFSSLRLESALAHLDSPPRYTQNRQSMKN